MQRVASRCWQIRDRAARAAVKSAHGGEGGTEVLAGTEALSTQRLMLAAADASNRRASHASVSKDYFGASGDRTLRRFGINRFVWDASVRTVPTGRAWRALRAAEWNVLWLWRA